MTVNDIVKEHVKASDKLLKSLHRSPKKIRKLLIKAGILNKSGTRLARHCR